jgi:hypothetical protein
MAKIKLGRDPDRMAGNPQRDVTGIPPPPRFRFLKG